MKRLIIILISVLFTTSQSNATNIPLDSIKASIFTFLKVVESCTSADEVPPNFMIIDQKRGRIKEGKDGIFHFGLFVSGACLHYLLIGKDSFHILNMKEPIDINVSKLLTFLERNQYSKKDICFYLRELIKTYRYNEENIAIFNGVIK